MHRAWGLLGGGTGEHHDTLAVGRHVEVFLYAYSADLRGRPHMRYPRLERIALRGVIDGHNVVVEVLVQDLVCERDTPHPSRPRRALRGSRNGRVCRLQTAA